jgi:hypothetical protein
LCLFYIYRREITALQAENYSLERQLFSYQKSIAYAHSRGQYSADNTPGGTPEYPSNHGVSARHHSSSRHNSTGGVAGQRETAQAKHGHHYHGNHHTSSR